MRKSGSFRAPLARVAAFWAVGVGLIGFWVFSLKTATEIVTFFADSFRVKMTVAVVSICARPSIEAPYTIVFYPIFQPEQQRPP